MRLLVHVCFIGLHLMTGVLCGRATEDSEARKGVTTASPANARFPRLIRFETKFAPGFGKRRFQGSPRPDDFSQAISKVLTRGANGVADPVRILDTREQLEAIESERYRNALDWWGNLFELHQLLKNPNGVGRLTETNDGVPAMAALFGKNEESFDEDRSRAGIIDVIRESQAEPKEGEDAGWRPGRAMLRRNRNVLNDPSALKLVLEEMMRE